MNRPTSPSRLAILGAGAVALLLPFAAILASAGSPEGVPAPADPLALEPAPLLDLAEIDADPAACLVEDTADADLSNALATSDPELTEQAGRPVRGYCRCTCTLIPNCTTNADCGGGLCLKGPTCC